jgi:large subunit ribosomal protein L4
MVKIKSYDLDSKKTSTVDINDSLLNIEMDERIIHVVLKDYLYQKWQKSATAKTRAQVSGGGAKPWKQKGTGRARAGTTTSPVMVGGGKAFGPKNIKRRTKVNRKVKQKALLAMLSKKSHNLTVLTNESKFEVKKTKDVFNMLSTMGIEKNKILYVSNDVKNTQAMSNLSNVVISSVFGLNVFSLLKCQELLIEESSVRQLEEIYTNG